MSTMILMRPLVPSNITGTRGINWGLVGTPSPKEVFTDITPDGNAASFKLDLGSVQSFDTVFVGFTNADDNAQWSVLGGAGSYSTNTYLAAASAPTAYTKSATFPTPSDVPGARRHGLLQLVAPDAARYLQVFVAQPVGADPLQVGIVAVGQSFVPAEGQDMGSGQQPIDTGSSQQLIDGGFGILQGAVKSSFGWTYGGLTPAEVRTLRALALQTGETSPVLVAEDPTTAVTEDMHWGLLSKFQAYERFLPGRTRWALTITDWT